MGPSWYWMPDIFDNFFAQFGKKTEDYYNLRQLDPGFQIVFGENQLLEVPAELSALKERFEATEPGSSIALKKFLKEAQFKYEVGMKDLVYKPAFSWMEFANFQVAKGMLQSNLFSSVSSYVRKYFKDPKLVALMEFPVLFLGAMANKIPALYTMMNYSALVQGTWYPDGGMHQIVLGMQRLAKELGVTFHTNTPVQRILTEEGRVVGLQTANETFGCDGVIASADYHHVEQQLLEEKYRNYPESYWADKTFAPSCLIYYIGVNKRVDKLLHHSLFFDADFEKHAAEIYKTPAWPDKPLFYVCCPSKTDDSVAPAGMENLFILVPVATALVDTEDKRNEYFDGIISRIENFSGTSFKENIIYKKSYCINDFVHDYNAYGGNAYGLANTLSQTAVLKPSLRNKKLGNLFYTGQLTVPGPGVPPALISGQIAAQELLKVITKKQPHETTI